MIMAFCKPLRPPLVLTSHSCPRNKIKVLLSIRLEERHLFVYGVVSSYSKWNYFQLFQTRSHSKNPTAVSRLEQITIWSCVLSSRMWYSGGISAHNVAISTGTHSSFSMPLNLCENYLEVN